jgi:hypothetical protein
MDDDKEKRFFLFTERKGKKKPCERHALDGENEKKRI